MVASSFDSLRSLNVYMSSPRHLPFFILLLMMAICGAQGRIKRKHTCITYFAKSKTGSTEKIKSYHQIKMCTGMAMVCMVRWILGPEWVLDITIYMMNVLVMVRWTPGMEWVLVITIKFIGTPFCMFHLSPFSSFFWTWAISFFPHFFSCFEHVFSLFFLLSFFS